jgi:adenosylmethionine-8-amino-7-oxononanoate aminotransferase
MADGLVVRMVGDCIKSGVILGRNSNTIPGRCNVLLTAPPLVLTQEDADQIVETVTAAMGRAIQEHETTMGLGRSFARS